MRLTQKMMERLKAYTFLLLMIGVQFGSTGFTYYINTCSTSGATSVTHSYVGCRCTDDSMRTENQGSYETEITKKCCSSIKHFAAVADDYPTSIVEVNLIPSSDIHPFQTDLGIQEFVFDKKFVNAYFSEPPWQDYNKLLYIQSFLI